MLFFKFTGAPESLRTHRLSLRSSTDPPWPGGPFPQLE
jgi:hypothetical protein